MNSIIESISGSLITLSDSGLSTGVGTPLFNRLASLLNFVLRFFPVFIMIAFLWLMYGFFVGSFKTKNDQKNKSLDNK